jgi:triacylglycerol esterase/lipase EstA (alpha/beta hydrolase family)
MLSCLIRAQLGAELLGWLALGAWLYAARGWSVPALLAAAAGCVLLSRLLIVLAAVALSTALRSPREPAQQIGPAGMAALVASETRELLLDNFWRLPFEKLALRADPRPLRGGPAPVLIVHGYVSNRGLFGPLVAALEAAGAGQVFTASFRGIFAPIDAVVAQLDAKVRAVLEATGRERIVLVCHSMGGLVARAYLAKHGARGVERVVTIATPHNGTQLARLGPGENARQMRPASDFLRALAATEGDRGPMCPFTSIYTVHDTLVAPQDTSRLPWAKNEALAGCGHVGILGSAEAHLLVAEELRQAGALAAR